ncbi:MAG TPA: hypothetical protein DCM40_46355 [Maribacter sp.]|nr:hypothetical protein [Maribacter sp.]
MKFIDKKEKVMDLKLTSYGHYLLSIGKFNPKYYAFYDDNVLYDGAYANISESSNKIYDRIKNKTQYMESQVLFQEIETTPDIIDEGSMSYYQNDITAVMQKPRKDNFRYSQMIGDAYLQGDINHAPAWKIVMLDGNISSSLLVDDTNDFEIPQINLKLNYRLKTVPSRYRNREIEGDQILKLRKAATSTGRFTDNYKIELEFDDLMVYVEEQNTALLMENFDIEVFEILTGALAPRCPGCTPQDKFRKILFDKDLDRIKGGLLTDQSKAGFYESNLVEPLNHEVLGPFIPISTAQAKSSDLTSSVGYYFDLRTDMDVNHKIACRAENTFNKQSLYIDLDFDCKNILGASNQIQAFDIYGPVTDSELCE